MPKEAARHTAGGVSPTVRIQMPKRRPRPGQDAGTPRDSVQAIVRTLDALVRAGRPETGRTNESFVPRLKTHLDRLMRDLDTYLEEHAFLQLTVGRRLLRFQGETVLKLRGNRGLLASILSTGDVVEILFKRGVRRDEIERFVRVLHRTPRVPDGINSAAASLWECDFEGIRIRCVEEQLPFRPARFEAFDLTNKPVKRADETSADVTLDPAYTAAAEVDAMPHLDLDALPQSLLGAVSGSAPGAVVETEPFMPRGEAAVQELGRVLIAMQRAERDTGALDLGRELLIRILELRLGAHRWDAVHELLVELCEQSRHRAVAITFRRVVAALCRERYVLAFGNILRASRTRVDEASVLRKILALLGETALEPLWDIFQDAQDEEDRAAVSAVLTAVAWQDPSELVRHVEMRAWNEVRDVIFILGQIGGSKVLPALRRWTTHGDSRVRIEVVRALTSHDQAAATAVLCEMLADQDHRVRQSAVWALAMRGDRRALPRLREIVFENEEFRERSLDERDDFFRTCGRLADGNTLEQLAGFVQQRQLVARGWKAELRRGAALALGESGWERARELLEKAVKSRDSRLGQACRNALSSMASSQEVEATDKRMPAPRSRDKTARARKLPTSRSGESDAVTFDTTTEEPPPLEVE